MLARQIVSASRKVCRSSNTVNKRQQTRSSGTGVLKLQDFYQPINAAAAGARSSLSVLPEKVPVSTGALPSASAVNVSQVNGVTFVAVNEPKPTMSMSLFVKAGSRYEDESSAGSANFLKRLAFRSTEKKYYYPLILDVDKQGVEYESAASREFVSYHLDGLRTDGALMSETLGAVIQPRLEEWEVEAVRAEVLSEVESRQGEGRLALLDVVHREAFRDQGLGRSANAAAHEASSLTPLALRQYVNSHYVPERMIVVANGASMDELKDYAAQFEPYNVESTIKTALGSGLEGYFPALMPAKAIHAAKTVYTGGAEVRLPGAGATQIIVAAEGVGAAQGLQAQLATALLQTIVGGGSSALYAILPAFKQSRLGKTVTDGQGYLQYAEAFHLSYADAGLFGIFAQAEAGNVPRLAEALAKQFQTLPAISEAEVTRAKLQLKANLFASFAQDSHALAEFYAAQVANTGAALTLTQFAQHIDTIDAAQVVAIAKKIAASKLTVAALGDVKGLPKF